MCCGVVRLSSHRRPKGQLQPRVDLETFRAYCVQRRVTVGIDYRRHRWKRYIKPQQSGKKLYQRLRGIHEQGTRHADAGARLRLARRRSLEARILKKKDAH